MSKLVYTDKDGNLVTIDPNPYYYLGLQEADIRDGDGYLTYKGDGIYFMLVDSADVFLKLGILNSIFEIGIKEKATFVSRVGDYYYLAIAVNSGDPDIAIFVYIKASSNAKRVIDVYQKLGFEMSMVQAEAKLYVLLEKGESVYTMMGPLRNEKTIETDVDNLLLKLSFPEVMLKIQNPNELDGTYFVK